MSYKPNLDDFVIWKKQNNITVEGWVYFCDNEYISIEVSVKEKPDSLVQFHKKTHCLVVCPRCCWDELEYVKTRKEID